MLSWMVAVFIWVITLVYFAGTTKMVMTGELEKLGFGFAWLAAITRYGICVAFIFLGIWVAPL